MAAKEDELADMPAGVTLFLDACTTVVWENDAKASEVASGTPLTFVASAAAVWTVYDERGRRGRISATNLPKLAQAVLDHQIPATGPILDLHPLDPLRVAIAKQGKHRPELVSGFETMLASARDVGERLTLLRNAATGSLRGDPSAERRFRGLVELLLSRAPQPSGSGFGLDPALADVYRDLLPQLPRFRLPCLIQPRLLDPIYRGISNMAYGDLGLGKPAERFINGAFAALENELAIVDRLALVAEVAGQHDGFDTGAQMQAIMSFGTPVGLDVPSRFRVSGPLVNWCAIERGAQAERAARCFCREFYRINEIESRTLDLSGNVRIGEACHGDTIVIRGQGFGDARRTSAGVSRVMFERHGRGSAEAAAYVVDRWSDTEVEVVVPEEAITGIVAMEIICSVDADCGVITKAPRPSTARTLSIIGPPRIRTFGNPSSPGEIGDTSGIICSEVPVRVDLTGVEEAFLTDDRGTRHDFEAGALGPLRNIDTIIQLRALETLRHTLIARNACGDIQAEISVERTTSGWLQIRPPFPVLVRGETREFEVLITCTPDELDLSELIVELTTDEPGLVSLDATTVRFGPSDTRATVGARVSNEDCGTTVVYARPVGQDRHPVIGGVDPASARIYVVDVPVIETVTGELSACDSSNLEFEARCAIAPRLRQFVVFNGPDGTTFQSNPVTSTSRDSDVAVMSIAVGPLEQGRWDARVRVEADSGPLTSEPVLRISWSAHPEVVSFSLSPMMIRFPGRLTPIDLQFGVRNAREVYLLARPSTSEDWREIQTWTTPFGTRDMCGDRVWTGSGRASFSRREQLRLVAKGFSDQYSTPSERWLEVEPVQCIRIHAKIIEPPYVSINDQIEAMNSIFGVWNMRGVLASTTTLTLPEFIDVNTGDCNTHASHESERLFTLHRGDAPHDEVALYFVRSITHAGGSLYGCAAHRPAPPSALVARGAPLYTVAHEIGHTLGLPHPNETGGFPHRLMNSNEGWIDLPPDLIESEATTCLTSRLTNPC